MLVNAKRQKEIIPKRMMGTAILTDLDKKIYTISPTKKHPIAVLVPDWNIPHNAKKPTIK